MIESLETRYDRLPLEQMGDAGHGMIESEELIVARIRASGWWARGTPTPSRGGRGEKPALRARVPSLHRRGIAEVVQIDPITLGGIAPVPRVLRMADSAGLPTSSRYADELNAHLLCASQNPVYAGGGRNSRRSRFSSFGRSSGIQWLAPSIRS